MSKGRGATQRKILDWLAAQPRQIVLRVPPERIGGDEIWPEAVYAFPRWQPVANLAREIYGCPDRRAARSR